MTKRVCLEPSCPVITNQRRCPAHTRQRDRARGTRYERGYDNTHDRLRAAWQAELDQGRPIKCWRCGQSIDPHAWHLGHDDHDRSIYRGPECPSCNVSAAGRLSHL